MLIFSVYLFFNIFHFIVEASSGTLDLNNK